MLVSHLIGNLGKDAVINTVSGKTVINFSVAHTEKFKDAQGNQRENTIWVECSWWVERTAIVPYLKKGTQVYVYGNPNVKSFQRNDGSPGASFVMRVRDVQLLGSKKEGQDTGGGGQQNYTGPSSSIPHPNEITEPIDDLPF